MLTSFLIFVAVTWLIVTPLIPALLFVALRDYFRGKQMSAEVGTTLFWWALLAVPVVSSALVALTEWGGFQ